MEAIYNAAGFRIGAYAMYLEGFGLKIGAQLYTVRDVCKTIDGLDMAMKKVAEIGYKYVQLSPWREFGAQKIRELADKYGLEIIVTHYPPQKLLENPKEAMEAHKILGTNKIGIGAMPDVYRENRETVLKFINDYRPAIDEISKNGFKFMYHNHEFEYEKLDGKLMIDYLLEAFPPEQMGVLLDLFWVQAGGADPAEWIVKLKGRVETIHFKDYAIVNKQRKTYEVMEGNMNWKAIFEACKQADVEWAFVEQDDCNGRDVFDCLKTSFNNLSKVGLC